ncbi:MAG TPA: hypothetical protein VFZ52_23290 [Chryseolinea sp.]
MPEQLYRLVLRRLKTTFFGYAAASVVIYSLFQCKGDSPNERIPQALSEYIDRIDFGKLGPHSPEVGYEVVADSVIKVAIAWNLPDTLRQDDWQVSIFPKFKTTFHWAPHLTPTSEHIIAQHVFRAPAMIMSSEEKQLTIIPDLDILAGDASVDWYMDLNAIENKMTLGMSESMVREHVLFTRQAGAVYPPGKITFGFYILIDKHRTNIFNPWRKAASFLWKTWGKPLYDRGEPLQTNDLEPYVKHTYNWAFNNWRNHVWQTFELNGKIVGAPAFIVNVTQSPNYPGEVNEREFRSVWNQAWFSSLRSAIGLYRYARRTNNTALLGYALKTKELAISFPQKNGFFPSVIATEMGKMTKDGKAYNRSKGWSTLYFGNSNRNPYTNNPKLAPFHVLDMSWTAYLMLTWYDDLEKDERLLKYAIRYADALLKIQDERGFFPAWISVDSLKNLEHLNQSPETSMSVTFLLKLYQITGEKKYFEPALNAMNAVIESNITVGQWEDFETYWSCSRFGAEDLVNKKVERNNMFKQNTFSMYWTAEALLNCYLVAKEKKYLDWGQRTLDELLMAQATWQPPYIYVNSLGGFGVMNADGEWNDSRQSLFSPLVVKYGKALNSKEYLERGLAALRASFVMMYCPENPKTKQQWEKRWNFFGEKDYGFMMENYGHEGTTSLEGVGIGEFTIYDWGNGAASEGYNTLLDLYGKEFVDN